MYDMLCPGCGHRIAMLLIDKICENKNIVDKTIFALDVACCSLLIDDIKYDAVMCPHGRVIPVSVGYKKVKKENIVISYMGDGAAYSIGFNELIHGASRKDDLLVIIINNGLFAMTGGQKSTTNMSNPPFLIEKILDSFDVRFMARAYLSDKDNIDNASQVLEEAIDSYMKYGNTNIVELVSPCPTNYHKNPKDAALILNDEVMKKYKKFKKVGAL